MYDHIADFFDKCCDAYGSSGWEASAWASPQSQRDMFYVLSRIGVSGNILDVGCGQGDYYEFLDEHYPEIEYTGIDISSRMVEYAKERYPYADFRQTNLMDFDGEHDWVLGAGPFNIRIGDHDQQYMYVCQQIRKMWELARKGAAFTLLSGLKDHKDMFPELYYYHPATTLDFCLKLTSKVVLDHATLSSQFVVYLLK